MVHEKSDRRHVIDIPGVVFSSATQLWDKRTIFSKCPVVDMRVIVPAPSFLRISGGINPKLQEV